MPKTDIEVHGRFGPNNAHIVFEDDQGWVRITFEEKEIELLQQDFIRAAAQMKAQMDINDQWRGQELRTFHCFRERKVYA